MNKTHYKKRIIQTVFILCLIFFNAGCGLDTYYVINPPSMVVHEPQYYDIDPGSSYFEFYTTESTYDDIKFLGTDVYYKIYRNTAVMENEYKNIISLAGNTETEAQAPSRMIDSYKYKTLEAYGFDSGEVLIPSVGVSRTVHVRLSDSSPYLSQILVSGTNAYGSADRVIPVRNIASSDGRVRSFSFKDLSSDLRPKKDDEDVNYSGSGSDSEWYIAMFAVSVAQDSNYTGIYSNVVFLGTVKISVQ